MKDREARVTPGGWVCTARCLVVAFMMGIVGERHFRGGSHEFSLSVFHIFSS